MRSNAFTLIETVMAITLMALVLTALTGLVISTLNVSTRNVHSLQATAFAQEGIEAMRFIRDSNWLQNYSWAGTARGDLWAGHFDVSLEDPIVLYLQEKSTPPYWGFSSLEEHGVVLSSQDFPFTRRVEVSSVTDESGALVEDMAEVNVIVEWNEKGIDKSVQLSTFLSNWQ